MNINQKGKQTQLDDAIKSAFYESFEYLIREYGFNFIDSKGWRTYIVRSNRCQITLIYEPYVLIAFLKPRGLAKLIIFLHGGIGIEINLVLIAKVLKLEKELPNKSGDEFWEISERIEEFAHFLKTYCSPFLRGDFSKWNSIEKPVLEIKKKFRKDLKNGKYPY